MSSRIFQFEGRALSEFHEWASVHKPTFDKIHKLLEEIRRTPFTGTGKPEPLKHEFKGYWSRRIDHEHRLIYKVTEEAIIIISFKGHYTS